MLAKGEPSYNGFLSAKNRATGPQNSPGLTMSSMLYGRSLYTLQSVVEQAFQLHAERSGIATRDGALTYGEIGLQAQRLAHYLNAEYSRSANAVRLVGIYGIHGADPIVATYGGVLAGGGYVPLNPHFPAERTAYMLRDSGVNVVYVCDRPAEDLVESLLPLLPEGTCAIVPDGVLERAPDFPGLRFVPKSILLDQPADSKFSAIPENACAYILYTSGSTGTPKGVKVSHANVAHFVREMVSTYGFSDADRFSQTTDLTFDFSVLGVFCAVASGGCVCPIEKIEKLSPVAYVNSRRLTVWYSVPSMAVNMQKLRMLAPGCMPTLRTSIFCGEPLTTACACQWQEAACNSVVENTYGPTEATVLCSRFRWDQKAEAREYTNGIVPIGFPLAGTGFAVVDAENHFVEDAPGELCIAGPQLCLGYTDPQNDAKAFFDAEDPRFRVRQRWYRTGDLAVQNRKGGWFEFLGRVDSQVKLLGNRVELGEVESVIRAAYGHDAVVVVPYPVEDGSAKGLVAFLGRFAGGANEAMLRDACERKLPSYMCPNRYIVLPVIPVNANGKYDRRALYQECERDARSG